jgi:hypothetical protein
MKRKSTEIPLEFLIKHHEYPHSVRTHGELKTEWRSLGPVGNVPVPEHSYKQLVRYAHWLQRLGMDDIDILIMFDDLYWEAVKEYNLGEKEKNEPSNPMQ